MEQNLYFDKTSVPDFATLLESYRVSDPRVATPIHRSITVVVQGWAANVARNSGYLPHDPAARFSFRVQLIRREAGDTRLIPT
jgi:hypothetical protein